VTIPALAGGAAYTATASVAFPVGLAPGNYFVSAVADADGIVIEDSEANNGLTVPAQDRRPGSDRFGHGRATVGGAPDAAR
jgi:hypothetical protein